MEVSMKDIFADDNQKATPFSYLDKGIDDMEADRLHTAEDAFRIIRARLADEI